MFSGHSAWSKSMQRTISMQGLTIAAVTAGLKETCIIGLSHLYMCAI